MELAEHQTLYVRELGRVVRVTALFTSADAANAYMATHPGDGVIKEIGPFIFLANMGDVGVKTPLC